MLCLLYLSLYLAGFYSIFLAWRVLSKPGISGSVRRLIMKRHTASIMLFVVCNMYTLGYCIQVSLGQ